MKLIQPEHEIVAGLKKLVNKTLFKDIVDFNVTLKKLNHEWYKITYTIIVDHDKYWQNAPNYSKEYNELVNLTDIEIPDELFEFPKYFGISGEIDARIYYEHFNTKVYNPLLDILSQKNINFVTEFTKNSPYINIILDENLIIDYVSLFENSGFNVDDICVYQDNLSE